MCREEAGDKFVWDLVCQGRKAEQEGMPSAGCYAVAIFQLRSGDKEGLGALEKRLGYGSRAQGSFCSRPVPWKKGFLLVLAGTAAQQEGFWQKWSLCPESEKAGVGVGTSCRLSQLWQSFEEARIAGSFQETNGREGFVQKFSGLGVFLSLFRQSWEEARAFADEQLAPLRAHDKAYRTNLLPTLKVLFRRDFNWKESAEELFVHVNTLRYRYEKIKEILKCEQGCMDMRATLYAAVRVSETLEALEAPVFAQLCMREGAETFYADPAEAYDFQLHDVRAALGHYPAGRGNVVPFVPRRVSGPYGQQGVR